MQLKSIKKLYSNFIENKIIQFGKMMGQDDYYFDSWILIRRKDIFTHQKKIKNLVVRIYMCSITLIHICCCVVHLKRSEGIKRACIPLATLYGVRSMIRLIIIDNEMISYGLWKWIAIKSWRIINKRKEEKQEKAERLWV